MYGQQNEIEQAYDSDDVLTSIVDSLRRQHEMPRDITPVVMHDHASVIMFGLVGHLLKSEKMRLCGIENEQSAKNEQSARRKT